MVQNLNHSPVQSLRCQWTMSSHRMSFGFVPLLPRCSEDHLRGLLHRTPAGPHHPKKRLLEVSMQRLILAWDRGLHRIVPTAKTHVRVAVQVVQALQCRSCSAHLASIPKKVAAVQYWAVPIAQIAGMAQWWAG